MYRVFKYFFYKNKLVFVYNERKTNQGVEQAFRKLLSLDELFVAQGKLGFIEQQRLSFGYHLLRPSPKVLD